MDAQAWLAHWDRVRQGTLATIGLFHEDELGFTPVEGGYSIRDIALHIAHEEAIEVLHGLAGLIADLPEPYSARSYPSKAAIVAQLEGVHAQSIAYLSQVGEDALERETDLAWGERLRPIDVLLHVIEHETHHRGELSLALGLLGRRGFDA